MSRNIFTYIFPLRNPNKFSKGFLRTEKPIGARIWHRSVQGGLSETRKPLEQLRAKPAAWMDDKNLTRKNSICSPRDWHLSA